MGQHQANGKTKMKLEEAQAAIGKTVAVSDGTARPPERFNRKLAKWKQSNYTGRLDEVKENFDQSRYIGMICTKECSYMAMNIWTNIKKISSVV